MLFPALLLVLTALFLAITMLQPIYEKMEKPLWKYSILPLLYASPGTQLMASGGEHDMEAKSIQLQDLKTHVKINGHLLIYPEKGHDLHNVKNFS